MTNWCSCLLFFCDFISFGFIAAFIYRNSWDSGNDGVKEVPDSNLHRTYVNRCSMRRYLAMSLASLWFYGILFQFQSTGFYVTIWWCNSCDSTEAQTHAFTRTSAHVMGFLFGKRQLVTVPLLHFL